MACPTDVGQAMQPSEKSAGRGGVVDLADALGALTDLILHLRPLGDRALTHDEGIIAGGQDIGHLALELRQFLVLGGGEGRIHHRLIHELPATPQVVPAGQLLVDELMVIFYIFFAIHFTAIVGV